MWHSSASLLGFSLERVETILRGVRTVVTGMMVSMITLQEPQQTTILATIICGLHKVRGDPGVLA